jgi:hypothetical protein
MEIHSWASSQFDSTQASSNPSFEGTRSPVTQFAVANWAPVPRAPQLDR